jgi:hypothetical protein
MKNALFSKADERVSYLTWTGGLLFLLYAICMFVYPAFSNGWDGWNWDYIQRVWDRWQTLNAGVLAILASVIALNISKYHESKQREWRFIAAKAFLPSALSELLGYFKLSAKLFVEAYESLERNPPSNHIPLTTALPKLPVSYAETFRQCIDQAEPDVGEYLANILVELQVHHSRMTELHEAYSADSRMMSNKSSLKSYIYRLGQLYALVGKVFPFARGQEGFDRSALVWENYRNAYGLLDVEIEDIEDLAGFTNRAIERATTKSDS